MDFLFDSLSSSPSFDINALEIDTINDEETSFTNDEGKGEKEQVFIPTICDGTFFKVNMDNGCNKITASCMLCKPINVDIKGYATSSTNFVAHLRNIHGETAVKEYQECAKKKKKKMPKQNKRKSSHTYEDDKIKKSLSSDKFAELVIKFVVDTIPLHSIENKYFQELMR